MLPALQIASDWLVAHWYRLTAPPVQPAANLTMEAENPAEPGPDLDGLNWRPHHIGEELNVTYAQVTQQLHAGCVRYRLRLYGGGDVYVTMPLRAADRLAREVLRARLLQYERGPTCRRPPRWLAGAFPLRSGRLLPAEPRS